MDLTCSVRAGTLTVTRSRSSVRAWLVPDVALLISFVTLIYCLVLFDGTQKLFRDSDTGWHIRTGEAMLAGKGLPRVDSWSFVRSGQPWFAWEWGADVLMGAAHLAGGPAYVAGLYALAIAACTFLWFRLNWMTGGNFLLACGLVIPMLTTAMMHWHARPHVFGWLFVLSAVLYAERKGRSYAMVALASALWANLHASFFLGAVVAAVYAASHWLRPLIWDRPDRETEWRDARWYAGAAIVSLAATLVNPYGWHLHQHVTGYLLNQELLDRVGEFQSFNFHAEGSAQIVSAITVAGLGSVLALGQRNLAHSLLSALFLVMALRSARVLPLVALIALPLANGAISAALRSVTGLHPAVRRALDAFLQYCDNLRTHDRSLGGLAVAPAVVALTFAVLSLHAVAAHAGFPRDTFPVQAAGTVSRLPESARLLAPDLYGGYLIYRFNGQRKVWSDGRSDFYGADFMKDYLRIIEVRPGWHRRVKQTGFTHALLPNRYSLVPALEGMGWKRLHSDSVATLLESPAPVKD
jgi:hypothetical protein